MTRHAAQHQQQRADQEFGVGAHVGGGRPATTSTPARAQASRSMLSVPTLTAGRRPAAAARSRSACGVERHRRRHARSRAPAQRAAEAARVAAPVRARSCTAWRAPSQCSTSGSSGSTISTSMRHASGMQGWRQQMRRPNRHMPESSRKSTQSEKVTMQVQKAVFPVAGLGTRFLPATKAQPKEMLPVVDKPLIQYAVEEAYAAGVRDMIFVTGRNKRAIEDHFDTDLRARDRARGSRQARPAATGAQRQARRHGLHPTCASRGRSAWAMPCCARQPLVGNEPFAVLLADDLMVGPTAAGAHADGRAVRRVARLASWRCRKCRRAHARATASSPARRSTTA